MIKILQTFIFISIFIPSILANETDSFSKETFMKTYLDAIINKDQPKYESLLLSKVEMEFVIEANKTEYPFCVTEDEKKYNINPKLEQYSNIIKNLPIVNSYTILNASPMKGCGKIEGMKMNISLNFNDTALQNHTFVLIKVKENYKIVFDLISQ